MESLWPNVDINKVDIVSPLHILNEQANHLGEMTKNVVIAEVSKTKISIEPSFKLRKHRTTKQMTKVTVV